MGSPLVAEQGQAGGCLVAYLVLRYEDRCQEDCIQRHPCPQGAIGRRLWTPQVVATLYHLKVSSPG